MSEINNKNKSFLSSILFVALAASFCSFLWGSATPCIKIGYKLFSIAPTDTATVILFAGVRFFIAGILTAIVGSLMERKFLFPASKGAWGKVFVLSMFQTVIQYFFFYGGWKELISAEEVQRLLAATGNETLINHFSPPILVKVVCTGWLGVTGSVLAVLGVVAAPITSGDTALRSIRLIIAETLNIEQRSILKRLVICIPIFLLTGGLLWWQIENPDSFNILWQYFGLSNQTLTVFTLWAITVYLVRKRKFYYITLIPALFMTEVCSLFALVSPLVLGLSNPALVTAVAAPVVLAVSLLWFELWKRRYRKNHPAEGKK